MLQQAGSTETVSKALCLTTSVMFLQKGSFLSMYSSLQDACEETSYDPGATPQEV